MNKRNVFLIFLSGVISGVLIMGSLEWGGHVVDWDDRLNLYGYTLIEERYYDDEIYMILSHCLEDVSIDGSMKKYGIIDITDISILESDGNIAVSFGFKNSLDLRLSYISKKKDGKPFAKRIYSIS